MIYVESDLRKDSQPYQQHIYIEACLGLPQLFNNWAQWHKKYNISLMTIQNTKKLIIKDIVLCVCVTSEIVYSIYKWHCVYNYYNKDIMWVPS